MNGSRARSYWTYLETQRPRCRDPGVLPSALSTVNSASTWRRSAANKFRCLFQGIGGRTASPTDTCRFIHKQDIPPERFKDISYGKFECSVRPQKVDEPRRTRLVFGGNTITGAGDVGTPTADMLLVKIMLNSVVSTPGAEFMGIDISDFYLEC